MEVISHPIEARPQSVENTTKSAPSPRAAAIIPARFASTRFPGKPLADIGGRSMIERVFMQAKKAKLLNAVYVATDDERIYKAVQSFGGQPIMTGSEHPSGTDRLAEVARNHPDMDIIVNVQGDEPLIDPGSIDAAVKPMLDQPSLEMSTLCWRIKDPEQVFSPQVCKVVFDKNGMALYFSRHAIPYTRDQSDLGKTAYFGHIGLYVYRREVLLKLAAMSQTALEKAESLEQLRALENGIKIKVIEVSGRSQAVDVPQDIARVEAILKHSAPIQHL